MTKFSVLMALLAAILAALKGTGVLTASWLVVLAPFWAPPALAWIALVVIGLILSVINLIQLRS